MAHRGSWKWLAILLAGAWWAGAGLAGPALAEPAKPAKDQAPKDKEDDYELQKVLVDTIDQVQRNYVREVSRRKLVEAAIKGILSELDPYSAYISPKEMDRFRTAVESEFGGIGIEVMLEGGKLIVRSPLVGTPAYRAGLMAGDAIVEIDGKSTAHITIDEAVQQLKGKPGTQVTLTVVHPGSEAREKVPITRERSSTSTPCWATAASPTIAGTSCSTRKRESATSASSRSAGRPAASCAGLWRISSGRISAAWFSICGSTRAGC